MNSEANTTAELMIICVAAASPTRFLGSTPVSFGEAETANLGPAKCKKDVQLPPVELVPLNSDTVPENTLESSENGRENRYNNKNNTESTDAEEVKENFTGYGGSSGAAMGAPVGLIGGQQVREEFAHCTRATASPGEGFTGCHGGRATEAPGEGFTWLSFNLILIFVIFYYAGKLTFLRGPLLQPPARILTPTLSQRKTHTAITSLTTTSVKARWAVIQTIVAKTQTTDAANWVLI